MIEQIVETAKAEEQEPAAPAKNIRKRRAKPSASRLEAAAAARKNRTPYAERKSGFVVKKRPGFVQRMVVATEQRIEAIEELGYKVASNPLTQGETLKVPSGAGHMVLMEIPEQLYADDRASKRSILDHTEEMIVGENGQEGLKKNQFTPGGRNTITRGP